MWSLVCCLCSLDEILTRLSLVFDRWTTTPTPPSEPTDGFIAMGCTVLASLPCSGTCCTTLATRGSLRTVATHTDVDVLAHPSDSGMTAWFTTATGDELNDTLERVAHQDLMEFCEHHLPGLVGTAVALFPIQNDGNAAWSERLAPVGDPKRPTYHAGWAFMVHYA
jgi:hypothetical protein